MNGHIGHSALRAVLDRELPPAELTKAEEHLADCPDCRWKARARRFREALGRSKARLRAEGGRSRNLLPHQ